MQAFTNVTVSEKDQISVEEFQNTVAIEVTGSGSRIRLGISKELVDDLRRRLARVAVPVPIKRSNNKLIDIEHRLRTGLGLDEVLVADLPLPTRILRVLKYGYATNCTYVDEVLRIRPSQLLREPNFGRKSLNELVFFLGQYNLRLADEASVDED